MIVIVAVVAVTAVAYVYVLPTDGNTPEEVFLAIIDAINDDDDEMLIGCSVACFADDTVKENALTELEIELWPFTAWSAILQSYELLSGDESPYLQQTLSELVDYNERTYSVEVLDYCIIIAQYTASIDGQSFDEEQPLPFVKIDANWYLGLIPIPEGEGTVTLSE
ncbi:MAG: hypothetical protein KKE24_03770 [Candidatus Thermoplasmatota archaeon]|nr:hypothetical protein [Candidatus Thermoplasmatota archaeon]